MVSLNWSLNVLLNVVNKLSMELNLSLSVCINDSMNCRPFLPSQFFFITAKCSACGCCKIWKYCLPLAWSFWVFCFPVEIGLLHCGSAYSGYCVLWSFISSCSHGLYCCSHCLSHCLGYYFMGICLFTCHYVLLPLMSAYVRLLLLTPCSVSCLNEDNTGWCLDLILLLCHESMHYMYMCV